MQILAVSKQNQDEAIAAAVVVLKKGGLVVFPTETAYGIAADATNEAGVAKLLEFKERPSGKAISIAVTDKEMSEKFVILNDEASQVYRQFLPGPVTVISKSKKMTDKRLESERGTLGIRIPDFEFTLKLIKQLGRPITATSANPSGRKTPYSIKDVIANCSQTQIELLDLALDWGDLPKRPTSTVVDTTTSEMQVLRAGAVNPDKFLNREVITSDLKMQELGLKTMKSRLVDLKNNCVLFLLDGELGSGKTQFVKGIAKTLGIKQNVTSPTYTIINEYKLRNNKELIHMDAWRLEGYRELKELRIGQYLKPGNVVAIEWSAATLRQISELIHSRKKMNVIEVFFKYLDESSREVKIYVKEGESR